MKKIFALALAASLAAASFSVTAAPAMAQEKATPNPWRDCGIGAALFENTPVAAVLSNIIWDYGLTGTSSALSSPETCNGSRFKTAAFINETYARLEVDAAKGEGEYLATLASVMHCTEAAKPQLYRAARAGLTEAVSAPGFTALTQEQKAEQFFNVVDTAAKTELNGACYTA